MRLRPESDQSFYSLVTDGAMSAIEALRWFMQRDRLRQSDLPEIGDQAKVSETLSGRRAIDLRKARALAARFGVPPEMFTD